MINTYNRSDERMCELIDKDLNKLMRTSGTIDTPSEVYMDDHIRVKCDMKIGSIFRCIKDTDWENNNPVSSNTTKYLCDIGTDMLLVSYNDRDYWNQKRMELYKKGSFPKRRYPEF
jgi:hypothetical protein